MADWLRLAGNCQLILTKVRVHNYLRRSHQLYRLRPLRRFGDLIEVIRTAIWGIGRTPQGVHLREQGQAVTLKLGVAHSREVYP